MLNQTKTMLIGLFVVVACGLIIGMILFVEPSIGDNKQVLFIRFSNVNGINVGTRVTFAGKPIGEITSIQTINNARAQPTDELGQIYYYQLTAHIDSHVKVYTTDEITIQTTGLLGERSVVIMPKYPPRGFEAKLATEKTPLYGNAVDPIESAFHELGSLADKVEEAVDRVITWVDQNGSAVGDAVRSFDRAMTEFGDTLASVNDSNLVDTIGETLTSFTETSTSVNKVIKEMEDNKAFTNAAIAIANIKDSTAYLENILQQIEQGKGTIGKLISYDDFYLKLMSIFSKVDITMNDINHYGILFNTNKQWQRARAKRANLLTALKTPQEFKEYFEGEIDMITTSMARISVLIEKAEQTPQKQKILNSPSFRKDFAELLRRSSELVDSIKYYNEQFEDATQPLECEN